MFFSRNCNGKKNPNGNPRKSDEDNASDELNFPSGSSFEYLPDSSEADLEDMLLVQDVPFEYIRSEDGRRDFAHLILANCSLPLSDHYFILSKASNGIYFRNLRRSHIERIMQCEILPKCKVMRRTIIVPKDNSFMPGFIFALMVANGLEEVKIRVLAEAFHRRMLILPDKLILNRDFLRVEGDVIRRVYHERPEQPLDMIYVSISLRVLAPIVKRIVTKERPLDKKFLTKVLREIEAVPLLERTRKIHVVKGESEAKLLEHLVTCVPGIEVVWKNGRKYVREFEKIVVPEVRRRDSQRNQANERQRKLVDRLKTDLYVGLRELWSEETQGSLGNLRDFIREDTKTFQIVGEVGNEYVTLSHRKQLKHFRNRVDQILREEYRRFMTTQEIVSKFGARTGQEFSLNRFNVCYLDDLVVTLPQNWKLHCVEYLDSDGRIRFRVFGGGAEDIPSFVQLPKAGTVLWAHWPVLSSFYRKNLATLREQFLGMFREEIATGNVLNLRGPELTVSLNTLIRLYGVKYGQILKTAYGLESVFDCLERMPETFRVSGDRAKNPTVTLTADARRRIAEDWIFQILLKSGRQLSGTMVIAEAAPMLRFYPLGEVDGILKTSALTETFYGCLNERSVKFAANRGFLLRPRDPCLQLKIEIIEEIMRSFEPVSKDYLQSKVAPDDPDQQKEANDVLNQLISSGAVRKLIGDSEHRLELHGVLRLVKNLVYQLNDMAQGHAPAPHTLSEIVELLRYSGDFSYLTHEQLYEILKAFPMFFEETRRAFQLRPRHVSPLDEDERAVLQRMREIRRNRTGNRH